jgi:hypothetical protein
MKRYSLIPLAVIPLLLLSACTADSKTEGKTINFDSQKLTMAPQWDLSDVVAGSWGKDNTPIPEITQNPEEEQKDEFVPENPDYESDGENNEIIEDPFEAVAPDDVFLYNYLSFYDTSTKCRITGQISYMEAYKENRNDEFNSKEYLYALVPATENPVSKEKSEIINKVEYVVGDYTQPAEWGNGAFHRTAVRVFSTPVTIEDASGFAENELGNYNSDLTKGLSTVAIDYSCPDAVSLTDAQWKDGIKNFSLLFDAKKEKVKEPTEDAPVEEMPTENMPDSGVETSEIPAPESE